MVSSSNKYYLLEVNIQPSLTRINYKIDLLQDFVKLVVEPVLSTNKGYRPFMSMTHDIILVEPNMSHLQELYNITKNIEIMQYIGNLKPWSYEKTKRFIEYGPSENYYYKAIILGSKLQGIIGMYKDKTTYYNLTIFLNNSGQGIGTKALSLFLLTIDVSILYADVLNSNEKSIKFFMKKYPYKIINNIHRFTITN